jgi:hypothetical protein
MIDRAHDRQQRIKQAFDRKNSKEDFQLGDLVLKWDAPKQDRGKHNKFEALWIGPSKSLRYIQIIHTGCRIWRAIKFSVAL